MLNDELLERIRRFPEWYYEFDLDGYKTPLAARESAVRHRQRKAYFFEPVVEALGGSLAGKRVLDLGCNEGFFALAAAERGCDFVLGIDAQPGKIEQSRLVFEANGIAPDRFDLRCGDFLAALERETGPFDVVLALGILHWLPWADHFRLLQAAAGVNTDLLIVDTVVSARSGSVLELRSESLGARDLRAGDRLSILPSRRGLLEIMRSLGYQGAVLRPRFADWTGSEDYRDGARRAFVFAKQTSLDRLAAPREAVGEGDDARGLLDVSGKALVKALVAKAARALGLRRG